MKNKKTCFFDSLFVVFFHYNSVSCVITDRFSSKNIYTCPPSILCPLFIGGSGFLKVHKIFKIKTFCKYRRGVFKMHCFSSIMHGFCGSNALYLASVAHKTVVYKNA